VFQKDYFPVLISNLLMSEMDGLALCRQIRKSQHDNDTYIALLTALGRKPTYLQAMAGGADDFMTKPFDADQLSTRIRAAECIVGARTGMSPNSRAWYRSAVAKDS
jgi:two-component system, cell cycle response regulator